MNRDWKDGFSQCAGEKVLQEEDEGLFFAGEHGTGAFMGRMTLTQNLDDEPIESELGLYSDTKTR